MKRMTVVVCLAAVLFVCGSAALHAETSSPEEIFEIVWDTFDRGRKDLPPNSWFVAAPELNALGYDLIAAKRLEDAVGVFQLYVELFPADANAHDSLGEAFMERGDSARAIASYERSLELDPDNGNAVKMLAKLRE